MKRYKIELIVHSEAADILAFQTPPDPAAYSDLRAAMVKHSGVMSISVTDEGEVVNA